MQMGKNKNQTSNTPNFNRKAEVHLDPAYFQIQNVEEEEIPDNFNNEFSLPMNKTIKEDSIKKLNADVHINSVEQK